MVRNTCQFGMVGRRLWSTHHYRREESIASRCRARVTTADKQMRITTSSAGVDGELKLGNVLSDFLYLEFERASAS